jgi:hypothetical protein
MEQVALESQIQKDFIASFWIIIYEVVLENLFCIL